MKLALEHARGEPDDPQAAPQEIAILCGDAEALELEPCSVDSIVSDPPAAISFMGAAWDDDRGGRDGWIQWLARQYAPSFRALKPGGHALIWALPRTSHWTVPALELAGFEIRDIVHDILSLDDAVAAFAATLDSAQRQALARIVEGATPASAIFYQIFGCLTDDVDVLTPTGWRRGIDIAIGDTVAQWDPASSQISFARVAETYRAPWSGDLNLLENADTSQALTPNHRVWHRRTTYSRGWSEYRVSEACEITRRAPVRVPLAGTHDGPGIGGTRYAELLGWIWTEGGFDKSPSNGVRVYQSSVNQNNVDAIDDVLTEFYPGRSHYQRTRTYESRRRGPTTYVEHSWFFTGPLAARVREDLPGKHPTWNLLWRMTLAEKRAFIAAAIRGDGCTAKRGGAIAFYQKSDADREWFIALLACVGWRGVDNPRKCAVSVTQHGDSTLSTANLAKQSESYVGDVWCVRVSTGAFVARRKGKVFVTGNSGFPKSLTSASAEIPEWAGTALKPAVEHWILARKPLEGSVAANYAAHGTGVLNIAAGRIEIAGQEGSWGKDRGANGDSGFYTPGTNVARSSQPGEKRAPGGRWPAHLALDECAAAELDEQSGALKSSLRTGGKLDRIGYKRDATRITTDLPGSSGGASRFFYVAKPSRKEKEAGLAHLATSSGGEATGREDGSAGVANPRAGAGRTGGARNVHPTVKSVALMSWLIRLVTPPGGVVLDPFAGSGTTGVAAIRGGFSFVGVEQGGPCVACGECGESAHAGADHAYDPKYLPILLGRIANEIDECDARAQAATEKAKP